MHNRGGRPIGRADRRRALRLGYWNGALWAIGNALTTGPLVIYLALDLGGAGVTLSLILAIPSLMGLLRIAAPAIIRRAGTAKRACLMTYLGSYLLLSVLPFLAVQRSLSGRSTLWAVIGLLCLHQLLEYIAQAAQWAWMADLVPPSIRGRYFSRRQVWQLAVVIPALWGGGYFADWWKQNHPSVPLVAYAIPTGIGAVLLFSSIVPLAMMPAKTPRSNTRLPVVEASGLRVGDARQSAVENTAANRAFRRLLLFGCWFSLANGLTQSAQNIHPKAVLGLAVFELAVLRTVMQVGQMGLSPWVGRFSDRYGNRPMLVLSQAVSALGPMFYLLASPRQPWWIAGAWIAWSAYVGLNICTPNLILKLSGDASAARYIARYYALSSLTHAAATVAGGYLLDELRALPSPIRLGAFHLDAFDLQFACGWALRTVAILLLVGIAEPGAWSWREIVSRLQRISIRNGN